MSNRVNIVIDEHIQEELIRLRKTDEFCQCSFSEIVRMLIRKGLEADEEDRK